MMDISRIKRQILTGYGRHLNEIIREEGKWVK